MRRLRCTPLGGGRYAFLCVDGPEATFPKRWWHPFAVSAYDFEIGNRTHSLARGPLRDRMLARWQALVSEAAQLESRCHFAASPSAEGRRAQRLSAEAAILRATRLHKRALLVRTHRKRRARSAYLEALGAKDKCK